MGGLRIVPGEGEWLVLADWPGLVLIPATAQTAQDALVQAIWNALQGAAGIEAVVSAIPVRGTDAVPSFAVLRFEDPWDAPAQRVTGVVRGSAVVDLLSIGGARRFGSRGAEPWALAEFSDIVGITAGRLPPVPESAPVVPIGARRHDRGIAHASSIVWAADADDLAHVAPPLAPDHGEAVADDTLLRQPPAPADPAGETEAEPEPEQEPESARAEGPDPTQPAAPEPHFTVSVNNSAPVDLLTPLVIGRSPRERRTLSSLPQHLLTVASPTREVSSNHVEIAPSGRTVVVTDLRSTNGTIVRPEGTAPVRLRQGDSFVATGSAIVEIGDGNVIHISSRDRGKTVPTA
ncbi:FHA domain-containing protein [Herbiconiux sp. P15]|uniref:FHA domain-containing protein n=1 Tax=Herbiconiux liukaitaii TaxID=3342799 RepID=UPI0035B85356